MFAWVTGRPAKGQLPRHAAAVEASVGMARSTDGGLTWTGAMVPGSPDDHSQASLNSPIYGLDAMTDPKGAAGPCGYAYVVLVAFTRGGESRIAVARWQDKNNKDGSEAWYYQGTSVVETGLNSTNGQFHDLPSIVVDPLRVTGGDPCAHNVYVGWARFNGNAGASVLNFGRATAGSSANWNPTWALRFVGSMDKTNQAVTLAVDPRPGTPLSNGGGTLTTAGAPSNHRTARTGIGWRDPPTSATRSRKRSSSPAPRRSIRTTSRRSRATRSDRSSWRSAPTRSRPSRSVPNAAENPTGSTVYMAWQERVNMSSCPGSGCGSPDPFGEPKIVLTRSPDGKKWSTRTAVDIGNRDVVPPPNGLGYLPQLRQSGGQLMPRLSYGGGRLALFYYESRGPLTVIPPYGTVLAGLDRHLDARLALLDLVDGHLIGTSQVSRYLLKPFTDLSNGETVEDVVEVAPGVPAVNARVNVPNSGSGRIPFLGDYVGITPIVRLVPGAPGGPWRWAISPSDVPFQGFRTVFADSRNQIPPPGNAEQQVAQYPFYSPPKQNEPSCVNPGSRNHDVMHAVVNASVTLNAATTFKQNNIERAFPVTVGNPADVKRFYRLTLDPSDIASWTQSADVQNPEHFRLDVELFPFASSTRNAYLSATTATASVKVTVRELQLSGAQCTGDSQTLDNPLCTITVAADGPRIHDPEPGPDQSALRSRRRDDDHGEP